MQLNWATTPRQKCVQVTLVVCPLALLIAVCLVGMYSFAQEHSIAIVMPIAGLIATIALGYGLLASNHLLPKKWSEPFFRIMGK